MDHFKEALKKKLMMKHDGDAVHEGIGVDSAEDLDTHMNPKAGFMGEHEGADEHIEDDAKSQEGTDLAPDLKGAGEGHPLDGHMVADNDLGDELHQHHQLSPEEHQKILAAIADSHLGGKGREPSSLHERAAAKAKMAMKK